MSENKFPSGKEDSGNLLGSIGDGEKEDFYVILLLVTQPSPEGLPSS